MSWILFVAMVKIVAYFKAAEMCVDGTIAVCKITKKHIIENCLYGNDKID